jgi:predicted nucleotidyltransferase
VLHVAVTPTQLEEFCKRWQVSEFALFGSVLRDDFRPDSDVDVLVTFAPAAHPTLFDLARMQRELKTLFGRNVDLLTRRGVEASRNRVRRDAILFSAETLYVT